ncbi:unnamed protein product [Closterium sp. NIES-53]
MCPRTLYTYHETNSVVSHPRLTPFGSRTSSFHSVARRTRRYHGRISRRSVLLSLCRLLDHLAVDCWLTFLLQELGFPQSAPTLWCDNQSTIHISQDPVYHTRTKHIELRHFFIRDLVQQEQLKVEYVASDCNLADLFTKPLGKVTHHRLLGAMGLWSTIKEEEEEEEDGEDEDSSDERSPGEEDGAVWLVLNAMSTYRESGTN